METLSSIEAFVRSAEQGSFSAAARTLALTPAAVSKSVAKLEDSLGVRLFQRTTRKLTLTEAGEHLFGDAARGLSTLQEALERASGERNEPAGTLKVSLATSFGRKYVQPMMGAYMKACPRVTPELHFENRQVELVAEGYDAGVGAGLELSAGLVAREIARVHIVAVASKAYLKRKGTPKTPADLAGHDFIRFRSARSGKLHVWTLKNSRGGQHTVDDKATIIMSAVEAMTSATMDGLGLALLPTTETLEGIERGQLVRVLPDWFADAGPLLVYFSSQRLLPMRTRVFVDMLVKHFKDEQLAKRFRADV